MELSSSDDEEPNCVVAAEELCRYLMDLKHRSNISAVDACSLAYWATLAGVDAKCIKDMALKPGDPNTRAYSRKFDRATGANLWSPDFAVLDLPVYSKAESCKVTQSFACLPPQLTLLDEISSLANWDRTLAAYVRHLPPIYSEHVVVKRNPGRPVIPLAFYLDGVRFGVRQSTLGVWLVNLVTNRRHLVCSLKKSLLCRCGCAGWDTLWTIFAFVHWCFKALTAGRHEVRRFDMTHFRPQEARLGQVAGTEGLLGAILFVKADLGEFGTTLGLQSCGSHTYPCFLCDCKKRNMCELAGWDAVTSPHRKRSHADYELACSHCELWRDVTEAQHLRLRAILEHDRRKGKASSKGFRLVEDFPDLGLLAGDRLEPWVGLPNVDDFVSIEQFPARCLFWHPSAETLCHHRNPIFDSDLGVTTTDSAALDWLHTLSLGVFQTMSSFGMHKLLLQDAWATGQRNQSVRLAISVERLSAGLQDWLRSQRRVGRDVTEISGLRPEMFGSIGKPKFLLKASETNWFLEYFASVAIPTHLECLGEDGQPLLRAFQCLQQLRSLIHSHPMTFPAAAIQSFHDHIKEYLRICGSFGINPKPKDHMTMEMSDRIAFMGSPALYGNWVDESLNRLLRDVCAGSHSLVHDRRVLLEFPAAHDRQREQARRKRARS